MLDDHHSSLRRPSSRAVAKTTGQSWRTAFHIETALGSGAEARRRGRWLTIPCNNLADNAPYRQLDIISALVLHRILSQRTSPTHPHLTSSGGSVLYVAEE
jgi:hypothetical protein